MLFSINVSSENYANFISAFSLVLESDSFDNFKTNYVNEVRIYDDIVGHNSSFVDFSTGLAGVADLHMNLEYTVENAQIFGTRAVTVEETLFHELAHISLGHLTQIHSVELEQEAVNFTNENFRTEYGLSYRLGTAYGSFVGAEYLCDTLSGYGEDSTYFGLRRIHIDFGDSNILDGNGENESFFSSKPRLLRPINLEY